MTNHRWMDWAQRLQAIAQNGLAFTPNEYDRLRFLDVQKIATEMLAERSEWTEERFGDIFDSEKGYATPKVDVRGVVIEEDRILLVKERADGLWTCPGGWADVGISIRETVEKEIHEESGYEARALRLLAVYDRNKHDHPPFLYHTYKVFVLCELTGGAASASVETEGAAFFPDDALPPLSTPRVTAGQIARIFELYRRPQLGVDFD
jgi:ADP-ribose pyrophosphatase YjhB (NUDIX family)